MKSAPKTERQFGAILESLEDKIQIVIESTRDIPQMKQDIAEIKTWKPIVDMIPAIQNQVGENTKDIKEIKRVTNLTFEEVGNLREDHTELREEVKGIRRDLDKLKQQFETFSIQQQQQIRDLETRVQKLEQKIGA